MNAKARFLFDTDFGAPRGRRAEDAEPSITLALHTEELKRSTENAFLRGVSEGRAQAEADDAARLAGAAQRLAATVADLSETLDGVISATERDSIALAFAVARRLAGAALARYPTAELESIVRETFAELRQTPHVVVRVEQSLVESVTPLLDRIARETGFTGRIVILGDEAMQATDLRVEWADGGASRDMAALESALESMVARLAAPTPERTLP
jgi:flagellar assembly protein FliH